MNQRPYVLSIAGYDPSGGAGVLADVKTFESIGVYGLAVTTCITYQSDQAFDGVHWLSKKKIKQQLYPLLDAYQFEFVKVGLIKDLEVLSELLELLIGYNKKIRITWDPVLQTGTGFLFHKKLSQKNLRHVLGSIDLITPNWNEVKMLAKEKTEIKSAAKLAVSCPVFLKGGHNPESPGTDILFMDGQQHEFPPKSISTLKKHGTGCVLSSAITAFRAQGYSIPEACEKAKAYTFRFLTSNTSELGYHS